MLSVALIEGGPTAGSVAPEISCLAGIVAQLCPGKTQISIVFSVPGSFRPQIEFAGIRRGRFVKKDNLLFIHVAVPAELAETGEKSLIHQFLLKSLSDAKTMASEFFRTKGIAFEDQKCSDLMAAIAARLSGWAN